MLLPLFKFECYNCRSRAPVEDVWIGMKKSGADPTTLRWVDGTPFVYNDNNYYQTWYPAEPDVGASQACVEMWKTDQTWSDIECSQTQWALCEKPG